MFEPCAVLNTEYVTLLFSTELKGNKPHFMNILHMY